MRKAAKKKKKVMVILGTRPEIIKLARLIPYLDKVLNCQVLFTGQHYSFGLVQQIVNDLDLRPFDFHLHQKTVGHARQTGRTMEKIEEILLRERPDAVVVQGDTNSTLAGALTAAKLNIKVFHIEAGARCHRREVPEEVNRVLVDHISYFNFPFSRETLLNLAREGIKDRVKCFSNTAYDSCHYYWPKADGSHILQRLSLAKATYLLVTLHRAGNTDDQKTLKGLIKVLNRVAAHETIVFPMHPRTRKKISQLEIRFHQNIMLIEPVGYLDFLKLLAHAKAAISDSGGIVDEAAYLNRPLLILRGETERGDVLRAGKAVLVSPMQAAQSVFQGIMAFLDEKNLKRMRRRKMFIDTNVCQKIGDIISGDL